MTQDVIMWILGLAITGVFLILMSMIGKINNFSERIVRLETTIDIMGKNAAHSLHSPHTPSLDVLLDKYLDRNYELTALEWASLLEDCEQRMDDKNESQGYRWNAGFLAAICHHKLGHDIEKVKRIKH